MDIILKLMQFSCSVVLLPFVAVYGLKTSCQGRSPHESNIIVHCYGKLYQPVCFLCNISKSFKDVLWFVDGMMVAYKGHNIDEAHVGSVAVNGCPEYEDYSLRLERPTTQNHNSLYYCQHKKENVSVFNLSLHVDAVLSINSTSSSTGKLVVGENEPLQELQCVITSAVPPLLLLWSHNNVKKGEMMFNASSKEQATFVYTMSFNDLKTGDIVTCSGKGSYIESDNASLTIYVSHDTEGNRIKNDYWPDTTPTDDYPQTKDLDKMWIPAGLIVFTLFSFSTFLILRRYYKQDSVNIGNVTRNNAVARNGQSGESVYEPYTNIEDAVARRNSKTDDTLSTTSLVSKIKFSGIYEYWTGTCRVDGTYEKKCFAKLLSGHATLQDASEFQSLARQIAQLSDSTNVVRMLCINIEKNPFSMVYELMEYGTLRDFVMTRYQQPSTSASDREASRLKTQIRELLTFATYVANAMVFVTSQNFRHPVLSLRKVLLTSQCCCKLYDIYPSDMAMIKIAEIRKKNHSPIAWMSPETIFLHQYSLTSDVWSYSMLLWELFSLGEVPYAGKQDKEIENDVRRGVLLTQPPNCPRSVYDIMLLAWAKRSANRPSFQVMHEKLQSILTSLEEEEMSAEVQYFTLEAHQTNEYI